MSRSGAARAEQANRQMTKADFMLTPYHSRQPDCQKNVKAEQKPRFLDFSGPLE
jgi:hypothetical protein